MKHLRKIQIAMAGIALAGTAHAQSNVAVYGVLDMNVEYVNNMSSTGAVAPSGPAVNRVAMLSGGQSGSRLGFRGTEDLGGGYKASFVLENGLNVDDGKALQAGRLFGRQAFVGIEGGFGKATFGRQYSTMFDILTDFAPGGFSNQYDPSVALVGNYLREDNMLKYTGTFGGLKAMAHWSLGVDHSGTASQRAGEVPGQSQDNAGFGAGLAYVTGPLGVVVAYDQVNPTAAGAAAVPGVHGKNRRTAAALSYALTPATKLTGGYRYGKSTSPLGAVVQRDNYYWAGINHQYSPTIGLTLAYYYDDVKDVQNPIGGAQMGDIANPSQLHFAGSYRLSKRTDVYLVAAYSRNGSLNFDNSVGALGTGYTLGAGKNSQLGTALGLRHRF